MKNDKLLNSIGNIDDELIENAVKEQPRKKTQKTWISWKMFATCAACLVFLFFGLFGAVLVYDNSTVGTFTLDINPSIELTVARNGKIKDVKFINEDAKKAFNGVELSRDSVESLVKQTIEQYKQLGYVVGEENIILVSYDEKISKDEKLKAQIEKSISTALDNTFKGELFIHQNSSNEEVKNFAQNYQISVGKADWVLSTANKTGQKPEDLVSLSVEELGQWQDEKPVPFGSLFIGITKAKQIALKDAGISSKITFITEKLINNGIKTPYYLLEFGNKSNYWKYHIDANNGNILVREHTGEMIEEFITLEKAKEIALNDSGIDESTKVVFTEEFLSRNNGRPCYVLSFNTDNNYYHYKIDAKSGDIIESRFIGLEKAKQIAINDAGISSRVLFIKSLLIDGGIKTPYYYLEFENSQAKWIYNIDAINGNINNKEKTDLNKVIMITVDEAKKIAIQDAELTGSEKIEFTKEETVQNNGKPYYDLDFKVDNNFYFNYKIDACSGDIFSTRYIGMEKAKQIALDDAKVSTRVKFTKTLLIDGGIKTPFYTIEFNTEDYQYLYNIDATNGEIRKKELTSLKNQMITVDEAKKIAIQDAELTGSEKIEFTKEDLYRNSGKPYYDLDFKVDNIFYYNYKIDAYTGDILSTRYIGMVKAKQIALENASVSNKVEFTKSSLTDGGIKTPYYTIEFNYDGYSFSYEINALNGNIIKCEKKEMN